MAEAIAEALAMLLPPGILFDSPHIYAEVAKLPVLPLEDIRRHWKSYTSMNKKLQDPTACRLESFWWHVWGSDRRQLSGKTLARLWKDIASGPTFVPLKGPPRRNGRPAVPPRNLHRSAQPQMPQTHETDSQADIQRSEVVMPQQGLTPSSSRPPPPHPILKKPRGPSNSGPRPTARFVDVPDSEEETISQNGTGSGSGESQPDNSNKTRPAVVARQSARSRSPAKGDRKTVSTKKFVVSTTASKRRPVLPRRQSSQSSTGSAAGSEAGSRDAASPTTKQTNQPVIYASPQQETPSRKQDGSWLSTHFEELTAAGKKTAQQPTNEASPEKKTKFKNVQQTKSRGASNHETPRRIPSPLSQQDCGQENHSQQTQGGTTGSRPSAKALGKQPEKNTNPMISSLNRNGDYFGTYDGTQRCSDSQSVRSATTTTHGDEKPGETKEEAQETHVRAERVSAGQASSQGSQAMVRSKSNNESKRLSSGPIPAAAFKSPSVVGMSNLAVTGGFDFEMPRARPLDEDMPPLGADQPDIRRSSVLDSKLAPTQPSPNPAPPMGRSKSQLTLLLERDKARISDKARVGGSIVHKNDVKKQG